MSCIISSFYIKPQLQVFYYIYKGSCIISSFYIKPQPTIKCIITWLKLYYIFILHQTTTQVGLNKSQTALYYIFILHQTTTSMTCTKIMRRLYYIFILHQTTTACLSLLAAVSVVLYLHSTSNHNSRMDLLYELELYYIFILHQTTTSDMAERYQFKLYYIFILHQTTTQRIRLDW